MRSFQYRQWRHLLICATLVGVTGAHAQLTETLPSGAVPTIDELRPAATTSKGQSTSLPDRPLPRELGKPADDITIDVKGYQVDEGAPEALKQALPGLTAAHTGNGLHYEDLMNAVNAVTRYLQRDLGFYLGQAYLPEQDPSGGMVRIAILEGRLDEVVLNWSDDIPVSRSVVEAHLARLTPGSILRVNDVERVVFLINDLRGLTARFDIKQGRKPGTASLVVTPTAEKSVSGKADADVNGSRFSGLYRLGATVNVNSPFKRGDSFLIGGLTTSGGGLRFLLAGYTLPIGSNGFKAGMSISKVNYKLTDEVPLSLNGEATAASIYALHPLVRSRNLNLFLQASYEQRDFTDSKGDLGPVADTVKRAKELRIGVAGDFRDGMLGGGISSYELALISSRVDYLKNGPALALLDPRDRTRLIMGFSRLNKVIDNRLLAYVNIIAQRAWSNLDTTEQFGIGGPGRVRAFAPGEGTGDEGQVVSMELRLIPPESLMGRLARETLFTLFYDWGHVKYKHDPSNQPLGFLEAQTFSGYGLGFTWERPKQFSTRISIAWPHRGTPQNDSVQRIPRVYATLTVPF